jgi:hypothetical protein
MLRIIVTAICCLCLLQPSYGEELAKWESNAIVNVGSGDFAPYYISSNRSGILTQSAGALIDGKISRNIDTSRRFDYGFGGEVYFGLYKSTDYLKWNNSTNSQHPGNAVLQQLWGEVKYRSLFLMAGMKDNDRSLFDSDLGVGDITLSRNARGIPQVRIGFIDFQNIPYTNGWVQIQGEIAYGKFADANWLENHYNYQNSFITTGVWFHYKRLYFRTNPDKPFSFTIGMQHAAQFGGTCRRYTDGVMTSESKEEVKFKNFIDVFFQKRGNSGDTDGARAYYNGNHLGSWDVKMTYRFHDQSTLTATIQSPWEDGSGIGKLNGWDGVWGLEYDTQRYGWISGVAVQYIDFTNQSGPMHWAPGDHEGTSITGQATGADDYYNNAFYNGWTNYGMSLGTPFIKSTLYNTDGYMRFTDTRTRGVQIGAKGKPNATLSYRVLASWRKSAGTPFLPALKKRENTSALIEATYAFPKIAGLSINGMVAFDAGKLYGNNFGACVGVTYRGNINIKR